jgi:hypothetical protein
MLFPNMELLHALNICAKQLSCAHPDICILCNHRSNDEYQCKAQINTSHKLKTQWTRTIAAPKARRRPYVCGMVQWPLGKTSQTK